MNKLLFSILLLTSCVTRRNFNGVYSAVATGYIKTIDLNKNGTFALSISTFDNTANCTGKWKFLSKDTIELKCDSDMFAILSSGYIKKRVQKVILLGNNQIKYEETVLIRTH